MRGRYGRGRPKSVVDANEERFWSRVDKHGPASPLDGTRCWLWTRSTTRGYGSFRLAGVRVPVYAHRFSYELLVGPIGSGLYLDHRATCPKVCVNPAHLRPVTPKQNSENRAGAQRNSQSGVRGVSPGRGGRWQANVKHRGKSVYVGEFPTIEAAEAAVIAKRNELFSHNGMDREVTA